MDLNDAGRVREVVTGAKGAVSEVLNELGRILRLTPRDEKLQ